MQVLLKEFLLYGRFAQLKAAMQAQEIEALFGPAEYVMLDENGMPEEMHYQSLRLFFKAAQLASISLHSMYRVGSLYNVFYLPDRLSIKPNLNYNNMSMAEIREFLEQADIGYRFERQSEDGAEIWRTEAGVRIMFGETEDYIDSFFYALQ
jgi:hypothetical protein